MPPKSPRQTNRIHLAYSGRPREKKLCLNQRISRVSELPISRFKNDNQTTDRCNQNKHLTVTHSETALTTEYLLASTVVSLFKRNK